MSFVVKSVCGTLV
ncbi:hypothetical protein K6U61_10785 [Vibrio vulnificus]|nr:hypothetical protein [Vibrio vulnificus]